MRTFRQGPETDRMTLRAMRVSDAEDFYTLNSNPETMRYTGEPPFESVQQAEDAITCYRDFDEIGFGRWACILKETNRMIGFCGLKYLPELDAIDLGYRFLPQHWGRGLGTEAAKASVDFGFQKMDLQKIIGLVLADNTPSIRVLEKVGMTLDGPINYLGDDALQYSITCH